MTFVPTQVHCATTSRLQPPDGSSKYASQRLTKEELSGVLQGLQVRFDIEQVKWRVTESTDEGTRGLMMPYADPRAYSDRLNDLFPPAGWTRKYTVQASAPVQRGPRGRQRRSWLPAK
jgi:hypothetical protein